MQKKCPRPIVSMLCVWLLAANFSFASNVNEFEPALEDNNIVSALLDIIKNKDETLPIRAAAHSALAEISPDPVKEFRWHAPEPGPPMNPEAWHRIPGEVLSQEDVWGMRVDPRSTFNLPGGMGLFYTSRPTQEVRHDDERLERLAEEGRAPAEVGSLAVTRDLKCWVDYPDNPVLDGVPHDWQAGHRTMLSDVLYDPDERRWVAYFGDRNGQYAGIRAVGVAYSHDMTNWEYHDEPVLTIHDYISHVPEAELTDALEQEGRVYLSWAHYCEGKFYIALSATDYGLAVLAGESPTGPFEFVRRHKEGDIPGSKPVHHAGRWYSVYTDSWDGQAGIGLMAADAPWGPYRRKTKEAPVVELSTTERKGPLLFHHDGVWGVLFTTGGHWSGPLTLQMAVADISPELLMLKCNSELEEAERQN